MMEFKVKDVSKLSYGKMPKEELLGKGSYPIFSGYKYQNAYPEKNVEKGDVIVVARGVGGTGDVKLVKEDAYLTNLSIKFELDRAVVDNRYFYYFFQKTNLRRLDSGSAQSQITIGDLNNVLIKVPPLPEQKAIAHILGTLDDKIELNRQMNQTLEAMAQALFKSWFVDFDPVMDNALASNQEIPDELQAMAEKRRVIASAAKQSQSHRLIDTNPELAAKFPSSFVFNEILGKWIPEGWEVKSLGEITCELRRGISPKYLEEGGVRVLNQKCIRNHQVDYSLARRNDHLKKNVDGRLLQVNDIVVNSTGTGTLGRVANILSLDEPTVVDSHVTVVRANDEIILKNYFNALMFSIENQIEEMGEGSTGQTELSRARLSEINVLVPSLKVQSVIDKRLNNFYKKKDLHNKESETLTQIRDRLLPELISGRVRVKKEILVNNF